MLNVARFISMVRTEMPCIEPVYLAKDMINSAYDFGFSSFALFFLSQQMISVAFLADWRVNVFRKFLIYISAISKRDFILFIKEIRELLAIVKRSVCFRVICDYF